MIDNSGAVVDHIVYDSFGNIKTHDMSYDLRFGYTGRELADEAGEGVWYYRRRFYDSKAGRFFTQDPLGFAAGDVNLYRYVNNSPLNFVDPGGLSATGTNRRSAGLGSVTTISSPGVSVDAGSSLGIGLAYTPDFGSFGPIQVDTGSGTFTPTTTSGLNSIAANLSQFGTSVVNGVSFLGTAIDQRLGQAQVFALTGTLPDRRDASFLGIGEASLSGAGTGLGKKEGKKEGRESIREVTGAWPTGSGACAML